MYALVRLRVPATASFQRAPSLLSSNLRLVPIHPPLFVPSSFLRSPFSPVFVALIAQLSSSTRLPFPDWHPSTFVVDEGPSRMHTITGSSSEERRDCALPERPGIVEFHAKQCSADRRSRTAKFRDFFLSSPRYPCCYFRPENPAPGNRESHDCISRDRITRK